MSRIAAFIFYSLLLIVLMLEGWGMPGGREVSYFMILLAPFLFFSLHIIANERVRLPLNLLLMFAIFLVGVSISTVFAVDIQKAFEYQLYYVSLVLILFFVMNHKEEIQKFFLPFVYISSISTLIYWVLFHLTIKNSFYSFIPNHYYQFIHRTEHVSHYPIGAFVLIPLIVSVFLAIEKKYIYLWIISAILCFIMIMSYLRASYVAFGITFVGIIIFAKSYHKLSKKIWAFSIFSLFLLSTTFIVITQFDRSNSFLKVSKVWLPNNTYMPYKTLLNGRDSYLFQAFSAIKEKPLTGFGSNNFIYISQKFSISNTTITGTSHNLLLDILTENGIVTLIGFVGFLFFVIRRRIFLLHKSTVQEKIILSMFMGIFILFQFNFYHRMYFMMIFFMTTLALVYKNENEVEDRGNIVFLLSTTLCFSGLLILLSTFLFKAHHYEQVLKIYPLHKESRETVIQTYKYQEEKITPLLNEYSQWYKEEPHALRFIGNRYEKIGQLSTALHFYKKSLDGFPTDYSLIQTTYLLTAKLNGYAQAKEWVRTFLKEKELINDYKNMTQEFISFKKWCALQGITL